MLIQIGLETITNSLEVVSKICHLNSIIMFSLEIVTNNSVI